MIEENNVETSTYTAEEARRDFAKILSIAVSENEDLRFFLQEEALKQFDKDFDVFYPYVKDNIVYEGKTFYSILCEYASPDELEAILKAEPKLTILVPDWSWAGCFSVTTWDPKGSRVAVGYEAQTETGELFYNGETLGYLGVGSLPEFPTLIVKSNERMKVAVGTKSDNNIYCFADPEFDNSKGEVATKVEHEYYRVVIDSIPDASNYVYPAEISNIAKTAYQLFGNSTYQRDFIYYGMTPSITQAPRRDVSIKEKIYKIKVGTFQSSYMHDDSSSDMRWLGSTLDYKLNHGSKTVEQLRNHFYAQGAIELRIIASVTKKSGQVCYANKVINASFSDLFALAYVDLDYRHRTAFCKDWYIYTASPSDVYSKWFTVNVDLFDQFSWDICMDAANVHFEVFEYDPSTTYNYSQTITNTYMHNFENKDELGATISGDGISGSIKVGLSFGNQQTTTSTTTISYERTQESDYLGNVDLSYTDSIITGWDQVTGRYRVRTYNTGSVEMMIIPMDF